jgi:hypothetical protein
VCLNRIGKDRSTFEAVQAKLVDNVRARQVRLNDSPASLMGRIFDDRGNRMTPSHSNKDGVRYRYYVSHTFLQRREKEAGRVTRVQRSSWRSSSSRRSAPRPSQMRNPKTTFLIAR